MTVRPFLLPADPLDRFLALYQQARDTGRWWEKQSNSLRHACLALVTLEGRPGDLIRRLRRTADELKSRSGMFSPMQNAMRYVYAAHLMAIELSPERILKESERLKQMLKAEKLPRSTSAYNIVTALVLLEQSLEAGGSARISRDQVARMAQIYRAFKEDHPWITGGDDLAPAALLAGEPGAPRAIASRVESVYQELRSFKYGRGNALQTAAQLLSLHPQAASGAVRQFDAIYQGFRGRGLWMMECDYDEVAALSFVSATPTTIVDRTLDRREAVRARRWGLGKNETFSVASSLTMLELLGQAASHEELAAFSMIVRIQAVIQAQAAATVAASSGGAAAAAS
ncbi:MAG: hypothetical protein CMJ94_08965 [Planctomycetes bacterium]|nr:hypothetical protein [Planctomycetota bacterium]